MFNWEGFRGRKQVERPLWVPIRQDFGPRVEAPVAEWVAREFRRPEIAGAIRPGARVAVAVGSRGIANLQDVVRLTIAELRRLGAEPFVVPAMGSHGGATAEGQAKVLAGYGITEEAVGAPVRSQSDLVSVGEIAVGAPLYTDTQAAQADAIVLVNRVKPHTSYRGPVESGLAKLLVIGLGKDMGARALHSRGTENFTTLIPAAAAILLTKLPVAFGLALIEGAYGELAHLEAVPSAQLLTREPELLADARSRMPHLPTDDLDVLVVHQMGKDVSGAGIDPNITGRYHVGHMKGNVRVDRMVVLNLTEASRGNAVGLGLADITTIRLVEGVDLAATYMNTLTGSSLVPAKIPLMAADDCAAIELAIASCVPRTPGRLRLAWIQDTKHLDRAYVSTDLWTELSGLPGFEPLGAPEPMRFSGEGRLLVNADL